LSNRHPESGVMLADDSVIVCVERIEIAVARCGPKSFHRDDLDRRACRTAPASSNSPKTVEMPARRMPSVNDSFPGTAEQRRHAGHRA
jgi:hypothetical protein